MSYVGNKHGVRICHVVKDHTMSKLQLLAAAACQAFCKDS